MKKQHHPLEPLCVHPETPLLQIMLQLEEAVSRGYIAGIALVTDDQGRLIGTITDGDIRRASARHGSFELSAREVMNASPITFPHHYSFRQILEELPLKLKASGRKSRRFLSKIVLVNEAGRPVRVLPYHQLWEQRVALHRHIVVLGMGYVGFTLALALAEHGFYVTGYDVQKTLIKQLKAGQAHIHERGLDAIFRRQLNKNFFPSASMPRDGEVYIIAVGTPLHGNGHATPDMSYLEAAAEMVGQVLQRGDLVVLRSTVPVGCSREVVLPILEKASGLEGGVDFFLSFAPERTAEGKALEELRNLPQLIGGLTEESVEATAAMFRDLTPTIVRLDSLEQAEIAKLLNNSFRDLVFSFANQVAQLAAHYNVDIVRTIRAANQGYPRNSIPLPSPGVGGPCLTKDPYIFSAAAEKAGISHPLFLHGRRVNEQMTDFVIKRFLAAFRQMEQAGGQKSSGKIVVCGLAFKGEPETGDLRHSTGVTIAHALQREGLQVLGHDPVAAAEEIEKIGLPAVGFEEGIRGASAVLFLNNHRFYRNIEPKELLEAMCSPALIFDAWRLFEPEEILRAAPCMYLGLSFQKKNF